MSDDREFFEVHCKGQFDELKEGIKGINGRLDKFSEQIDIVIFGNGKTKGMKVELAENRKDIDSLKTCIKTITAIASGIFIFVAGRFILLLVTQLGGAK